MRCDVVPYGFGWPVKANSRRTSKHRSQGRCNRCCPRPHRFRRRHLRPRTGQSRPRRHLTMPGYDPTTRRLPCSSNLGGAGVEQRHSEVGSRFGWTRRTVSYIVSIRFRLPRGSGTVPRAMLSFARVTSRANPWRIWKKRYNTRTCRRGSRAKSPSRGARGTSQWSTTGPRRM